VRFISWLLTYAIALAVAAWVFDGIWFNGAAHPFRAEFKDKWLDWLLVSLILGAISSFVKPILQILSIPFIIVTLGLFLLVINACMLLLTSWLAEQFDLGFHVDGFWTAVGGAIVITIVTWVVDGFIQPEKKLV
jgi:putative membrane protein